MSSPTRKPSPKSPNPRKKFKITLPPFLRHSASSPKPSPLRLKTKTQHLRQIFHLFDANHDGKLSADELRSIFSSDGGSEHFKPEQTSAALAGLDIDGDGLIGFNDFVAMMTAEEESEEELRRAFEEFEEEKGSGRISPAGLQRVFIRRLGEDRTVKDCEAMIKPFDLDGDGGLDFWEFKIMMTK
ncbi:probable calcium-binding protein CML41 [Phalaenopsis equestris]|uniref:probable calcium-binding protein CML41 n=1 Tax=Phalaenopsis equestris TaxID=78828 RepID=UPI0009E39636|nr:probable calcium-binding protein CML41 [Phalaenopsis equestris]